MKDFEDIAIPDLRVMIETKKVSAKEVCTYHLERIQSKNHDLGAITDVLADTALSEAALVDQRIADGEPIGRLAGIPLVVKDNVDTFPAICAAGLPNLTAHRPKSDAQIVKQLRSEGAVILGVTATDSGAFGVVSPLVKNPKFPGKIVGGSSGGSAAAVAAGLCMAAMGTDTGGSIRIPAACCGVIGLKPTFGMLSNSGVRLLSKSFDHVGPLARRVADIRMIMSLCANRNAQDDQLSVKALKIGIPESYFSDASLEAKQVVEEVAQCCEELGHEVCRVSLPTPDEIIPTHLVLSLSEAALIYADTPTDVMAILPKAAKDSIELGKTYSGQDYLKAMDHRAKLISRIESAFSEVDFLLTPILPTLPPIIGTSAIRIGAQSMSILQAMIRYTAAFDQSGHPALALPWPVAASGCTGSIQIIGRLRSDDLLLSLAEKIEAKRPPH
jgi:aspartyl-tRNA(Asn)/glutamyl-tRNA(Gln) amidotransferase subunit A